VSPVLARITRHFLQLRSLSCEHCADGEALGIDAKPNFRQAQGETLPTLMVKGQNEVVSDPRGRRVAPENRTFWSDLPGVCAIENQGRKGSPSRFPTQLLVLLHHHPGGAKE